jgi:hypothetical protein
LSPASTLLVCPALDSGGIPSGSNFVQVHLPSISSNLWTSLKHFLWYPVPPWPPNIYNLPLTKSAVWLARGSGAFTVSGDIIFSTGSSFIISASSSKHHLNLKPSSLFLTYNIWVVLYLSLVLKYPPKYKILSSSSTVAVWKYLGGILPSYDSFVHIHSLRPNFSVCNSPIFFTSWSNLSNSCVNCPPYNIINPVGSDGLLPPT